MVAFQAVMAQLIGGDTIHHACGIPVFAKGGEDEGAGTAQQVVAKRVLQWRWLIIDEISMVMVWKGSKAGSDRREQGRTEQSRASL